MRAVALFALAVVFAGGSAQAQTAGAPVDTADATPGPASDADERAWSFAASAYTYVVPESRTYVQPTIAADRGWLHLEARFNYEGLDTGSAWFGYNFGVGDRVALEFTPMVAAVFGNTTGIAPGYKGSLSWRALELYSEAEYVFDADDSADSFFFTWSELSLAPVEWYRLGLVVQRTKLYETEFDIQRGFFLGFSYRGADVTAYLLNPDASRPTVVLGVVLNF